MRVSYGYEKAVLCRASSDLPSGGLEDSSKQLKNSVDTKNGLQGAANELKQDNIQPPQNDRVSTDQTQHNDSYSASDILPGTKDSEIAAAHDQKPLSLQHAMDATSSGSNSKGIAEEVVADSLTGPQSLPSPFASADTGHLAAVLDRGVGKAFPLALTGVAFGTGSA